MVFTGRGAASAPVSLLLVACCCRLLTTGIMMVAFVRTVESSMTTEVMPAASRCVKRINQTDPHLLSWTLHGRM